MFRCGMSGNGHVHKPPLPILLPTPPHPLSLPIHLTPFSLLPGKRGVWRRRWLAVSSATPTRSRPFPPLSFNH